MTLREALEYCKAHKDVVARRPCWDRDNLRNTEGIFWHELESAYCYFYKIDKTRLVELPRGWGDSPQVGTAVSAIRLEDALAEDWVLLDSETWTEIGIDIGADICFEDNDHFAGGIWGDGTVTGYFGP